FDLALDDRRVDRLADVDGLHAAIDRHLVGVEIDPHVDEARGPAVHRVRRARVGRVVPRDPGRRLVLQRDLTVARHLASLPARPRTTMQVRLATVGPLSGTTAVDGSMTSITCVSTPSAVAAICVKIVIAPWPISVELDLTS